MELPRRPEEDSSSQAGGMVGAATAGASRKSGQNRFGPGGSEQKVKLGVEVFVQRSPVRHSQRLELNDLSAKSSPSRKLGYGGASSPRGLVAAPSGKKIRGLDEDSDDLTLDKVLKRLDAELDTDVQEFGVACASQLRRELKMEAARVQVRSCLLMSAFQLSWLFPLTEI
jgi:hypothetical protein